MLGGELYGNNSSALCFRESQGQSFTPPYVAVYLSVGGIKAAVLLDYLFTLEAESIVTLSTA